MTSTLVSVHPHIQRRGPGHYGRDGSAKISYRSAELAERVRARRDSPAHPLVVYECGDHWHIQSHSPPAWATASEWAREWFQPDYELGNRVSQHLKRENTQQATWLPAFIATVTRKIRQRNDQMTWTVSYDQATLECALEGQCPGCGGATKVVDGWSRCQAKPHPLLVEYQVSRHTDGQLHIDYRYQPGQLKSAEQSDCISHSKCVPTAIGHIVRFEDHKQGRNKLGWRLTREGAERLSRRWHDEAWRDFRIQSGREKGSYGKPLE